MSEIQTTSDPGLFSLAQIMHLLRVEFSRAQRYGYPLLCMVFGVDRLSALRDLYGYDSKEAIVQELVRCLQEGTRTCDFLGRMGDDKLLLIVPHTTIEGADVLAGRILEAVRELRFAGEGRNLTVTVSIGLAEMRRGSMFFDSLLNDAQDACKAAQKAGGDRYVVNKSDSDSRPA